MRRRSVDRPLLGAARVGGRRGGRPARRRGPGLARRRDRSRCSRLHRGSRLVRRARRLLGAGRRPAGRHPRPRPRSWSRRARRSSSCRRSPAARPECVRRDGRVEHHVTAGDLGAARAPYCSPLAVRRLPRVHRRRFRGTHAVRGGQPQDPTPASSQADHVGRAVETCSPARSAPTSPRRAGHAAAVLLRVLRAVPRHPAHAGRRGRARSRAWRTSRSTPSTTSSWSGGSAILRTPTTLVLDPAGAR